MIGLSARLGPGPRLDVIHSAAGSSIAVEWASGAIVTVVRPSPVEPAIGEAVGRPVVGRGMVWSRRSAVLSLAVGAVAALTLACFHPVLLRDRQFGFRDAGHHYYPLYLRVQQEWQAGRLPLWDPWENGGQPLLGNPTAAVLYPGKLIYALAPYPWAVRLYVVGHVLLAFGGCVGLLRGWGVSGIGATLGGMAYAFGAPVLFQHSNVIYLVGAGWLPWGLHAADSWLRRGSMRAIGGLAVVLAMETLGGDPESAYLTVLAGAGYALLLASRGEGDGRGRRLGFAFAIVAFLAVAGLMVAFSPNARAIATRLPPWFPSWRAMWAVVVLGVLGTGMLRCRKNSPRLVRGLLGLGGAAVVALGLSAAQLLPVAEFARASGHGTDRPTLDRYAFSLLPYRAIELAWPNVFGTYFPENRAWIRALPPRGEHTFWTPSLYLGGLTFALAMGSLGGFGTPPWRRWMAAVVLVGLLGSFGRYAGPIGLTRWLPALAQPLAGLEPPRDGPTRAHADFRDGDGSPYAMLATFLPGFDLFRYPSKLFTFASLGLSALAGLGWDRVRAGGGRRAERVAWAALALSILALVVVSIFRDPILASWRAGPTASPEAGPLQPEGAYRAFRWAFLHGGVVAALALVVIRLARRGRMLAGPLAVALLAVDLAIANAPLVWTVPQSTFEREPRALRAIREAERRDPAGGPFRVHRAPVWHPLDLFAEGSPDRVEELVAWERDTLQPLHGLPLDVATTLTLGVLEDESYLRQFHPTTRPIGPALAGTVGLAPGDPVLDFPRRAFDLWNTRYFLLPVDPAGWRDENRGYAAFLDRIDVVAPDPETFRDPARRSAWRGGEDWQIFRNRAAFPRAWVVHEARVMRPFETLDAAGKVARLRALFYDAGPIWNEPGRPVVDLRRTAWVEADDPRSLRLDLRPPPDGAGESVVVDHNDPTRVELAVRLASPGLVILADVDYAGWHLTLDGRPAPILRANHRMRSAAVPAGAHRLVFRYDPATFRVGAAVSLGFILVLGAFSLWAWRRPSARGTLATYSGAEG